MEAPWFLIICCSLPQKENRFCKPPPAVIREFIICHITKHSFIFPIRGGLTNHLEKRGGKAKEKERSGREGERGWKLPILIPSK